MCAPMLTVGIIIIIDFINERCKLSVFDNTVIFVGVVTVRFERQPGGEIQAVAYPRQEGGVVLTKRTLKACVGFESSPLVEQRVTAGTHTHTHTVYVIY